jgi:hypothetical protein
MSLFSGEETLKYYERCHPENTRGLDVCKLAIVTVWLRKARTQFMNFSLRRN